MNSTLIYIILLILTSSTLLIGLSSWGLFATIIVLLSILFKGQLIIDYFMGLKEVQFKYRLILLVWLGVVTAGIAACFTF